jgi:hypothetical protein
MRNQNNCDVVTFGKAVQELQELSDLPLIDVVAAKDLRHPIDNDQVGFSRFDCRYGAIILFGRLHLPMSRKKANPFIAIGRAVNDLEFTEVTSRAVVMLGNTPTAITNNARGVFVIKVQRSPRRNLLAKPL